MAEEKVGIKIEVDGSQGAKAVGNIRKEIKEATVALQQAQAQFGEYSGEAVAAAKRVAELKDRVESAAEAAALFDPGKKFAAFSGALNAVAGGFSAVQGALGLIGVESDEVQKQLLKVQSALALSQGLSTITDAQKNFQGLSATIKQTETFQKGLAAANLVTSTALKAVGVSAVTTSTGFKVLRGAIVATGIGALAVGLILLVQNFDKVRDAVFRFIPGLKSATEFIGGLVQSVTDFIGITSAADRATAKLISENSARIKAAERDLELNGDKYDQYTQRKIKANIDYRKSLEELTKDETLSIQERDKFIKQARDRADREIARADEDRNKAADEKRKADQKKTDDAAKVAADKKKAETDRLAGIEKQAIADIQKLKDEATIAAIKDEDQRQKKAIELALEREIERINALEILEPLKKQYREAAAKKADRDIQEISQKSADAEAALIRENAKKAQEVRDEIRLANIQDETIRDVEAIRMKYERQYSEIEAEEIKTNIQQTELRAALKIREQQEIEAIEKKGRDQATENRIQETFKQIEDDTLSYDARRAIIDAQIADLDRLNDAEGKYTQTRRELTQERIALDQAERDAKIQVAQQIAGAIGQLGNLFKQGTAAAKVAALSEIAINTGVGLIQGLDIAQKGAKATGPAAPFAFPIFYATQIAAVLGAAAKAKQVLRSDTGAGSSGITSTAAPSFTAPSNTAPIAPPRPQAVTTELGSRSLQGINAASTRAYVVESDITSSQERISRLNRAARLA